MSTEPPRRETRPSATRSLAGAQVTSIGRSVEGFESITLVARVTPGR